MKKILVLFLTTFTLFFSNKIQAQDATYQLSSHILDITSGQPAKNVTIKLSKLNEDGNWIEIDEKTTNKDGRVGTFLEVKKDISNFGTYKLTFLTKPYFESSKQDSFYPFIDVVFEIKDNNHYHVPITLSPFGYSSYKGS